MADRPDPQFTINLTVSEGFAVKDALRLLAYAKEANLECVAMFVAARQATPPAKELDAIAERLVGAMEPAVRDVAERIKALTQRHERDIEAEA